MKQPYVICHMICGVDGRTQTKHWKKGSGNVFEETAATIKSDGWIVGRVTMAEFASKKPRRKRKGRFNVPKTDYVAPHKEKTYAIAIDPSGKLHWETNHVDTEHLIEVLSEKVTSEYLDHLREAGVSYIFAGKHELNLKNALEKLYTLFNIKRITVQGGGTNNGAFLNAGLIDELSLVIMPFADGEKGTQSVFDIDAKDKKKPSRQLKLQSAKPYKSQHVWLHYLFVDA